MYYPYSIVRILILYLYSYNHRMGVLVKRRVGKTIPYHLAYELLASKGLDECKPATHQHERYICEEYYQVLPPFLREELAY